MGDLSEQALHAIAYTYQEAKNPIVLADVYAERFGLRSAVRELVAKTGMRAFCST